MNERGNRHNELMISALISVAKQAAVSADRQNVGQVIDVP